MRWIWPQYTTQPDETFDRLQNTISENKQIESTLGAKIVIAEKSLRGVTHLTEYEDDKANRILTAVAFLSAFAAVMFTVTMKEITFPSGDETGCASMVAHFYPYFYYSLFSLYALSMTWGVFLVLSGIRPVFNLPAHIKSDNPVSSLLFFKFILASSPEDWAKNYRDKTPHELNQQFFENCVVESYLIAGKIPRKLAFVELGTKYFVFSTFILLIWVVTTIIAELLYKL